MRGHGPAAGRTVVGSAAFAFALAFVAGLVLPGSATVSAGAGARTAPVWRPIASAPIEGRIGAGTVWTGEEMLVWGGYTRGPGTAFTANRDGAAYDPASDLWRRIRNAPAGVLGGGGSAAAWTGELAIFWAGNSPDGPARGAVYDPADDGWRKLPPGPLGPREGYVSAWTGDELLIIGGTSGDGFASPLAAAVTQDGHWRLLPALNDLEALIPSGAVWDGRRVFITGLRFHCPELGSSCTDADPVVLAYDPATDELEAIDPPAGTSPQVLGSSGTEVVFTGNGPRTRVHLFDPATGAWRSGGRGPCRQPGQLVWVGDRLVQACGDRRLQLYDPEADAWIPVVAGRSVLNRFGGSATAWTGRYLIAWSGVAPRRFSPTPNLGDRVTLPH